jgi:hypothetical protein
LSIKAASSAAGVMRRLLLVLRKKNIDNQFFFVLLLFLTSPFLSLSITKQTTKTQDQAKIKNKII